MSPLEWAVVEAIRAPSRAPMTTADLVEITLAVFDFMDAPSKAPLSSISRVLRRLVAGGVLFDWPSSKKRCGLRTAADGPVPDEIEESLMLENRRATNQILNTAVAVLGDLYPGRAPGEALAQWVAKRQREIN